MFCKMTAMADSLADSTRALNAYRLERDGETRAVVVDTPGVDSEYLPDSALKDAVISSDLILWVTAAPRPDRGVEREIGRASCRERGERCGRGGAWHTRT